jgi:hypothetical protein
MLATLVLMVDISHEYNATTTNSFSSCYNPLKDKKQRNDASDN